MGASFGILPPPFNWVKEDGFSNSGYQKTSHFSNSHGIIFPRAAIGGFILSEIITYIEGK